MAVHLLVSTVLSLKLAFLTIGFVLTPLMRIRDYIKGVVSWIDIDFEGEESLEDTNYLVIANHLSWYDFFIVRYFLFKFINNRHCTGIYKNGFFYHIYAWAYKVRGDHYIVKTSKECVPHNIKLLNRGHHCMLFPEGTRNRTGGGLLPFKKGIEYICKASKAKLVLIHLSNTNMILKGDNKATVRYRVLASDCYQNEDIEALYKKTFNL